MVNLPWNLDIYKWEEREWRNLLFLTFKNSKTVARNVHNDHIHSFFLTIFQLIVRGVKNDGKKCKVKDGIEMDLFIS